MTTLFSLFFKNLYTILDILPNNRWKQAFWSQPQWKNEGKENNLQETPLVLLDLRNKSSGILTVL